MNGTSESGATITRCKDCLKSCLPLRYVPASILRTLIAYCDAADPHVISAEEIKRVCNEHGIPASA